MINTFEENINLTNPKEFRPLETPNGAFNAQESSNLTYRNYATLNEIEEIINKDNCLYKDNSIKDNYRLRKFYGITKHYYLIKNLGIKYTIQLYIVFLIDVDMRKKVHKYWLNDRWTLDINNTKKTNDDVHFNNVLNKKYKRKLLKHKETNNDSLVSLNKKYERLLKRKLTEAHNNTKYNYFSFNNNLSKVDKLNDVFFCEGDLESSKLSTYETVLNTPARIPGTFRYSEDLGSSFLVNDWQFKITQDRLSGNYTLTYCLVVKVGTDPTAVKLKMFNNTYIVDLENKINKLLNAPCEHLEIEKINESRTSCMLFSYDTIHLDDMPIINIPDKFIN